MSRYRCGCDEPLNPETDGYKVTCKRCHQSWSGRINELESLDALIDCLEKRIEYLEKELKNGKT